MYVLASSKRAIIMEFVEGDKITDLEILEKKYGKASKATDLLLDIYARMIFLHGHVHCDAHPGNILVRTDDVGNPEIVLLDHGFYCSANETFRKQFCELWFAMVGMDYNKLKSVSEEMGIGEYYRYLPLLFTYRTINTTKPLGGKLAPEEKDFIKSNDEVNLDKIGMLL
jgi:aarF domain-containing kinase